MNTFRRRSGQFREYSGHNEVTEQLRNRIINCVRSYIGQPDPYAYGLDNFHGIDRRSLNASLDDEYGVQNSNYVSYLKQGSVEDVFTVVEIIIGQGKKQLFRKNYNELLNGLLNAFINSGSVYEIDQDGYVVLKLDEIAQTDISTAEHSLSKFEEAKKMYQNAVAKLVKRETPQSVVQDAYLSLEIYVKVKTGTEGKNAFDVGINKLLADKPVQKEFIKRLKGFKGNAKGISHDGNYEIDERDALWYVRSIGAVFSLLEIST